jgi:MarR-like DNA-binding transcriptional regulator SgrR of sgrS sRNA
MDLADISKEIYDSGKRLENGSKELFKLAKEMAETERDYRRALQIEIVKLKAEGMQATLIPDVARGKTSELKFKRDLAEARYKSARDSIEAIMSQMNGLQSILKIQKEI